MRARFVQVMWWMRFMKMYCRQQWINRHNRPKAAIRAVQPQRLTTDVSNRSLTKSNNTYNKQTNDKINQNTKNNQNNQIIYFFSLLFIWISCHLKTNANLASNFFVSIESINVSLSNDIGSLVSKLIRLNACVFDIFRFISKKFYEG